MATDGTSNTLMVGEYIVASSRLFVGNLTMSSEASVTGFGGGVVVASSDVNGDDDKPDVLIGHSGGDWTLDFQPQLTTEPTAPEDGATKVYAKPLTFTATITTPYDDPQLIAIQTRTGDATPETGTYALYQDVFIPTLDTETRIFDHEGYWY